MLLLYQQNCLMNYCTGEILGLAVVVSKLFPLYVKDL